MCIYIATSIPQFTVFWVIPEDTAGYLLLIERRGSNSCFHSVIQHTLIKYLLWKKTNQTFKTPCNWMENKVWPLLSRNLKENGQDSLVKNSLECKAEWSTEALSERWKLFSVAENRRGNLEEDWTRNWGTIGRGSDVGDGAIRYSQQNVQRMGNNWLFCC